MSYDLSFTEKFFTGSDEVGCTDYPTSVLEAIYNLPETEKLEIAVNLLGVEPDTAPIAIQTEDFEHRVLELVRETNTCKDLRSPVKVYIDDEGWYSVEVYDTKR